MYSSRSRPLIVFSSYADGDIVLCQELEQHLSLLQKQGIIEGRDHRRIPLGDKKSVTRNDYFSSADIILLLISPAFLASDVTHREMERALQHHEDNKKLVIPLLLRPCDRKHPLIADLQVLPRNEKPVTEWKSKSRAFEHIVQEIRLEIERTFGSGMQSSLAPTSQTMVLPPEPSSPSVSQDLVQEVLDQSSSSTSQGLMQEILNQPSPPTSQDLVQEPLDRSSSSTSQNLPSEETTSSPIALPRNPYKGLDAFRSEDAGDFFGRDRLTDRLVEQVRQRLTTGTNDADEMTERLLTVLGPSGSGKSSIVMAGLVPRLQQGVLPGSQHWVYLDMIVPGTRPLESLVLALTSRFPQLSPGSIRNDLQDDEARGLHMLLAAYVKQSGKRVVLVIDQLEELFTQAVREEERQRFLDLLLTATTEPRGPLFVILVLRADFYHRLLRYHKLGGVIERHYITVHPMDVQALRAVIEKPARLPDVQVTFEGGLVSDLLHDIREQAGTLPLLQFTLDRLFQQRQERILTLRSYHDMGGVRGVLVQHAEDIYQSLSLQNKQLGRSILLRLIDIGTVEGDINKRRIPLSAFTLTDPEKTKMLANVIEIFTNKRLLTLNASGEVVTVEVSHEAIIAWDRLRDWLREAQDAIRLQQRISVDAAEWRQHRDSTGRLYRGDRLAEALDWKNANISNIDEDTFLDASVEEEQRAQILEQRQRHHYTRRTLLIGVAGMAGMVSIGGLLVHERLTSSLPQSLPHPKSFPYTYKGHTSPVLSVAWSPDGMRIASASVDKTVRVWDVSSGSRLFSYTHHTDSVYSVAWSPDSKRLASAGLDRIVQIWDASNGTLLSSYTGHTLPVYSVAWSPDSKRLASASADNTVQVWNASNGTFLFSYTGHTLPVNSVAWSPDSRLIASASADATVRVWDASNGTSLITYTSHTAAVNSVAWSPNSRLIASASSDMTVRIWDASNGTSLITYTSHTAAVNSVAWAPDGMHIASAGADNTVQV